MNTRLTLNSTQTFEPRRAGSVGAALQDLGIAAGRLAQALVAALRHSAQEARPLTPAEEANEVREMAREYVVCNPGFAGDLYAAADRHERLHELDPAPAVPMG